MKIKEVLNLIDQGYEMRWDVQTHLGSVNKLLIEKNVAKKTLIAIGKRRNILATVDEKNKVINLDY